MALPVLSDTGRECADRPAVQAATDAMTIAEVADLQSARELIDHKLDRYRSASR